MPHFDDKLWSTVLASEDTKLNPAATPKAIGAFEAKQDFVLPDAHREFLLRGNGGVVGYCRLFGVGRKDYFDLATIITDMSPYIEGLSEGLVLPVASDWGGSFFCYDLRKPQSPKGYPVLYWNHEYTEEPEYHSMVWSKFAPNFIAFIKKVIKD